MVPWVRALGGSDPGRPRGFVTDGPFLHRTRSGRLLMIWSRFGEGGYAVGMARSRSDRLAGPWEQLAEPLFQRDGGHGMIFRTLDGRWLLALHQPNARAERLHLFELIDKGDRLALGAEVGDG